MSYNPTNDTSAGYISPLHQELLNQLKTSHKRTKRGELEQAIEQAYRSEFGYEAYAAEKNAHEIDTALTDLQPSDPEAKNR